MIIARLKYVMCCKQLTVNKNLFSQHAKAIPNQEVCIIKQMSEEKEKKRKFQEYGLNNNHLFYAQTGLAGEVPNLGQSPKFRTPLIMPRFSSIILKL